MLRLDNRGGRYMGEQEVLRVENLTKIYPGGVLANYNVNFSVNKGEIHALVGENGAGKSTLMKCLFGIEDVTGGKIFLNGEEIHLKGSQDAIAHGIGMVQQNMMLVPSLTVAENLVLGMEAHKGILIDKKKCIQEAEEISKKYSLSVDARKRVRDISVGMKQKLEILKTMYRGAKIIILDEPTAVLAPQETKELFQQLLKLKEDGYTIIFISHKLNEVKYLCDRMTILKAGKTVGTYQVSELTEEDISRKMVGRDVSISYEKTPGKFGAPVLWVQDVSYRDKFGIKLLDGVSFALREGEILGIAGIEGNGQLELMNIISGNLRPSQGSVLYQDQKLTHQTIRAIRDLGISHISEDRSYNGTASEMSVLNNLIATKLRRYSGKLGILDTGRIQKYGEECVDEFQIVTHSLNVPIKSLSGGNIQKAIVAREFTHDPEIIILNQPTRGVDIGAMEFIHKKILEARERQKSLLLLSSDLTELKALSDRIMVLYQGHLVGVIDCVNEVTEEELGLYMLGLKVDPADKLATA